MDESGNGMNYNLARPTIVANRSDPFEQAAGNYAIKEYLMGALFACRAENPQPVPPKKYSMVQLRQDYREDVEHKIEAKLQITLLGCGLHLALE